MRLNLRLALVIVLAVYVRAANLETVPLWDWDEGTNINYATNLMAGRAELFGLKYHFITHPPLYFISLAGWFKLFGGGIYWLRMFSVVCSVAVILMLYRLVRTALDEEAALFAALSAALCPELVFWGRMGWANDLLSALAVASAYHMRSFIESGRGRDLFFAAGFAGLCPLTEYAGVVFPLAVAAVAYSQGGRRHLEALAVGFAPLIVFAAAMLAFDGAGFARDAYWAFRLYPLPAFALAVCVVFHRRVLGLWERIVRSSFVGGVRENPAETLVFLGLGLWAFAPIDAQSVYFGSRMSGIFLISLFGLLFIEGAGFRRLLMTYMGCYFLALLALNRWDHMSIPLAYFGAAGAGFCFAKVRRYAGKAAPWACAAILLFPLAATLLADARDFGGAGLCVMPKDRLDRMNEFINQRTGRGDIVLTYSYLAPGLKADATIMENFVSYNGLTFGYRNRIYEPDEFTANMSAGNIAYMVLPEDYDDRLRKAGLGGLADSLREWKAVYAAGPDGTEGNLTDGQGDLDCSMVRVVLENPKRRNAQAG